MERGGRKKKIREGKKVGLKYKLHFGQTISGKKLIRIIQNIKANRFIVTRNQFSGEQQSRENNQTLIPFETSTLPPLEILIFHKIRSFQEWSKIVCILIICCGDKSVTPHEYASVANIFFSRSFFPIDERTNARPNARTRGETMRLAEGGREEGWRRFNPLFNPLESRFKWTGRRAAHFLFFNISPVARAKDRPFLYSSLPPQARPLFPVHPSRLSPPLFVIRAPMFNFARALAISNWAGWRRFVTDPSSQRRVPIIMFYPRNRLVHAWENILQATDSFDLSLM